MEKIRVQASYSNVGSLGKINKRLVEIIKQINKAGIGTNTIALITCLKLKNNDVINLVKE